MVVSLDLQIARKLDDGGSVVMVCGRGCGAAIKKETKELKKKYSSLCLYFYLIFLLLVFFAENSSHGRSTYVHCKAGRGRSTTIVICYLVKYKQMMPDAAYDYVKSIRPRVLLASAQWKAVQEFYHLKVKGSSPKHLTDLCLRSSRFLGKQELFALDDGSVVVITKEHLNGYDPRKGSDVSGSEIWPADMNLIYRVKIVSESALARLSYLWLHYQKITNEKSTIDDGCETDDASPPGITLDIHVFT
ncbi:hypothetical protein RD792_018072 [Penstemon davidsonii]|uniref:Tyrosine specific protein phosphatases domain-containing protein n=1 Tax=Penstemon davidsonii TaxID=160366 RepID=A0ABR0DWI5_9LAMI|nr:hypothetical protein RD792_018072 [Penstemon davidsonii]